MTRTILTGFLICLLMAWSSAWADAPAAQPYQGDQLESQYKQAAQQPTFLSMAADAVIVRPIMLATTIVGAGLFVVTLPFTLASNSVNKTEEVLVKEPARSTFTRCLGCDHVDTKS